MPETRYTSTPEGTRLSNQVAGDGTLNLVVSITCALRSTAFWGYILTQADVAATSIAYPIFVGRRGSRT